MCKQILLCGLLGFCLLFPLGASSFDGILVFGDSLSDTGNLAKDKNTCLPEPPFWGGTRTTNGPLAVEVLAGGLTLTLDSSLHVGTANPDCLGTSVGGNYAVGGAMASGDDEEDLVRQIGAYISDGSAFSNPLHVLFIGGNDILVATQLPSLPTYLSIWRLTTLPTASRVCIARMRTSRMRIFWWSLSPILARCRRLTEIENWPKQRPACRRNLTINCQATWPVFKALLVAQT